jgi:hypothetical protein
VQLTGTTHHTPIRTDSMFYSSRALLVSLPLSHTKASAAMPPRGPSAYLLFSGEHREAAKQQLKADGQPCAMGAVAKALGARWKALSEEERKVSACSLPLAECALEPLSPLPSRCTRTRRAARRQQPRWLRRRAQCGGGLLKGAS